MKKWPLKVSPSNYLDVYPDGPNAELAGEIVDKELTECREELDELEQLSRIGIDVLVYQLGPYLLDSGEDKKVSLILLDGWTWGTLHSLEMPPRGIPDFLRRKKSITKEIMKKYGLRFEKGGNIGPPKNFHVRPVSWKLKSLPCQYLLRQSSQRTKEKTLLAKEAVAPFEEAMATELIKVESALLKGFWPCKSQHIEWMMGVALSKAELCITYERYGGNQSPEHFRKIDDWINNYKMETLG